MSKGGFDPKKRECGSCKKYKELMICYTCHMAALRRITELEQELAALIRQQKGVQPKEQNR